MAGDLIWTSDSEFSVNGLRFKCLIDDYYADKTDADHVVILKSRGLIMHEVKLYRADGVKRVFEFGIFQGGSVMLLAEALGLERMAAMDISGPIEPLDSMIKARGLSDRIRLSYCASQRDRAGIELALASSFKPGELDLIIDDCSHLYAETKLSFEVAFPWLKPGGLYVIEDWGWAHWHGYWQTEEARWRDQPAMSNLIFELVMMTASSPQLISNIQISGGVAIVRKAPSAPVGQPLELERHYSLRGKTLRQI